MHYLRTKALIGGPGSASSGSPCRHAGKYAVPVNQRMEQRRAEMRDDRREGLAANQGEAADDGYAAGSEDDGLRETRTPAITLEGTGDAHALGMIAAEAGIDAVDLLEAVGETPGRQTIRGKPPTDAGDASMTAPIAASLTNTPVLVSNGRCPCGMTPFASSDPIIARRPVEMDAYSMSSLFQSGGS